MKTIDYYMGLPYKLEIVPDVEEGGYVARYPELPGCITLGDTLEDAVRFRKTRYAVYDMVRFAVVEPFAVVNLVVGRFG